MISLFELQAEASELGIHPSYVSRAINTIFRIFNVVSYYREDIIKVSYELHRLLSDYIDCIIVATAVSQQEPLVTEDNMIISVKDIIKERYGIDVFTYNDLVD